MINQRLYADSRLIVGQGTAGLPVGSFFGVALQRLVPSRTRPSMRELVDADRRKDELLATVCHELRSPLAAIRHATRLMGGPTKDGPGFELRALVERQVLRMNRLIEDLLDASRMAQGRLQLRRERVDLRAVVRDAIASQAEDVAERGHQLTVSLPDEPVWLMADPLRLEQVFVNLLANAAKCTARGGQVAVRVQVRDMQAIVGIRDSGIGMSPKLLSQVFNLYTRAADAETPAGSGLGIGLAVVRNLVELHGGSVAAASRGPGLGSEFTVYLPREA
jgi:two-component system, sensor histidine kinase